MKTKKGSKSQTGTLTSEEILKNLGGDVKEATRKAYDHYQGKTRVKKEDGFRNIPIIEDVPADPYKGISKKSKHQDSSAHGEGLDVTVAYDKKAHQRVMED